MLVLLGKISCTINMSEMTCPSRRAEQKNRERHRTNYWLEGEQICPQLAKVKVAGTLSEWFPVKKGVRQGRVLSPYLFNILAEMVMRETLDGFQGGLQIAGRMITNLR